MICIDPGHGGRDPGAVNLVREADITLAIALHLARFLSESRIPYTLTRDGDYYVSLSKRVQKAAQGSTCFISIHCNSASNHSASGIETLYPSSSGSSKAFANYVHQSLTSTFPKHHDRGLKMSPGASYQRDLYVLRMNRIPACLVETEFLSNIDIRDWILLSETQESIGYALYRGCINFMRSQGISLPCGAQNLTVNSENELNLSQRESEN